VPACVTVGVCDCDRVASDEREGLRVAFCDGDPVELGVNAGDGVPEPVWDGVGVTAWLRVPVELGVPERLGVRVCVGVLVGVRVRDCDCDCVCDCVPERACVPDSAWDGDVERVPVPEPDELPVSALLGVVVRDGVRVTVWLAVLLLVAVIDAVPVPEAVFDWLGVCVVVPDVVMLGVSVREGVGEGLGVRVPVLDCD